MNESKTFADFGVDQTLVDELAERDILHPFPIQELTLPMALKGADLIGQARTGTGKTLGFGLPLLQRIDPDKAATQAIVIVPTRELCLQVADDLTVGAARGITSIAVYGGVPYEEQIEALTSGVHVVVGTPGRTLDHLNKGNLDLSNVHVAVLDEADEMLDMGFLPDVERLLSAVPEDRQTMLFSATMPAVIVKLARRFMSQPTFMRAEAEESDISPTVNQHFLLVHRMDKPRILARILQQDRGSAFVFTRTKRMADRLVRELDDLRVNAIAVHGDLRQKTRERNLDKIRDGKADVLVATEVAARGIDVEHVTHVINYDCPDDEKMYLHRIGRTARAGASGVAVTFAEFNEVDRLNMIRKKVEADAEVAEVFSTSDELQDRFGLPDETPWDHLTSNTSTSSRGGSSRRKSSSSGRNQSKRSSDGSAPARRDSSKSKSSGKGGGSSKSGGRERTRTRTRTRERSSSSSSSDRTGRQRSSSNNGSSNERPKNESTPKKDTSSRSSRSRSRNRKGDGGKSKNSGSSKDSGSSKRRDENRGGSNGNNGNGSRKRSRARGGDARGTGTPTPRRRVKVDHLP